MRGEFVLVRAFGKRPLIRRIWEVGEAAIYVVSDAQFQLMVENSPEAVGPVGFPKEDVFKYDKKCAKFTNDLHPFDAIEWDKLEPWESV